MKVTRITPVLVVDSVEESLSLWEGQLGYQIEAQVPHGDRIGFVILKQGESEIMLQSRASVLDDLKVFRDPSEIPSVLLYANASSLDQINADVKDAETLVRNRTTHYGAKETWVKTGEGHVLGFAEFKGQNA